MIESEKGESRVKPSWEWTEEDLLLMQDNKTQESLYLDFKGSRSLVNSDGAKKELSKDVSSFANSEGGDIVYGVSESGKSPSCFGSVDEGIDPSNITPEWVEQVLNSNIHSRIVGLRITPIELKINKPGRFVYVIHIPMSYNAPHQASDKRYYKRFNFQSVAMEDYEIRDVRNRRERSELRVYCEILKARLTSLSNLKTWPTYILGIREGPVIVPSFDLRVWLINMGSKAAKHAQLVISFDNLRIQRLSGFATRIDDIRGGKPSLQWISMEEIIHANNKVKIMEMSLKVYDCNKFCAISTEVCAEDLPILKHDYQFRSSILFMANFTDSDGKKLMVSLDDFENMQKQIEA